MRVRGVAAALVAVLLPSIFRVWFLVSVVVFRKQRAGTTTQDAGTKRYTLLSFSFAA